MPVTAIKGIIENGGVRLCEKVNLPENTPVYVIVADFSDVPPPVSRIRTPRLAHPEQAADFRKQVMEIPGDAQL